MLTRHKSYVGQVPAFIRRGGIVHIAIGGVEVSAVPATVFCAAADAASTVAAELRAGSAPVPLRRRR